MSFFKWVLVIALVVVLLSAAALWSWGQFARRAVGEPSQALAVQPAQTAMDRWVAPMLAAHPEQTGAMLVSDNLKAFAVRALSARQAERPRKVRR